MTPSDTAVAPYLRRTIMDLSTGGEAGIGWTARESICESPVIVKFSDLGGQIILIISFVASFPNYIQALGTQNLVRAPQPPEKSTHGQ
jgi:hypothetical protein